MVMVTEVGLKRLTRKPIEIYTRIYKVDDVTVDLSILHECCVRALDMLTHAFPAAAPYQPSPYKAAGIFCFWIRKLKPFRIEGNPRENMYVNEALAFFIGLYIILGSAKSPSGRSLIPGMTSRFIRDYIASLRYNSHSPHSTAFVFESLFTQ